MKESSIEGVYQFESIKFKDNRGTFNKIVGSQTNFPSIDFNLKEIFHSYSNKGVVRGMHLQLGAASSNRIISCTSGRIFDILIDLRSSSPTYLEILRMELHPNKVDSIYVPEGVAHGFQALEPSTTLYLSDNLFDPSLDGGVNIKSLNIDFPIEVTQISERDLNLPNLETYTGASKE